MAGSDRWYFSKEVLANTPSRKCGIDADKELSYRQQAANLIQDMGQRLHVSQLCINTAIVYMHRFYTFHSFSKFHRNSISSCALFLAAKVEEQPRKLEHVIKVSHMCLHRETPPIDVKSEAYQEQAAELVFNENLMLQTLGFDIAVEHPHTSVVNCCQLVRASKDLAQTSYFMATNSLHLTTMCLQYKPTVVACVCIHLACKWSSWEIPRSSEGKDWFFYVDKSVTLELLEQLTSEFLAILDKCPSRLKRKIMTGNSSTTNISLKPNDTKKNPSQPKEEIKPAMPSKTSSQLPETSGATSSPPIKKIKNEPSTQHSNRPPVAMSYAAYRERKERTQQETVKQSEQQALKSNQSVKPLLQTASRDISAHQKDKPMVSDKSNTKQQQINLDKQKQMEERHKFKTKNTDYFANNNNNTNNNTNRQTTPSKPIASQHRQQNAITEDFYENLVNKPSNFNSIFSADGEDSLDFKNQITTDLKMEFSDNSNQSNEMLNLSSFTSDFINDSSDSKKSLNNNNINVSVNVNVNNNNKQQTNADTKQTSFMAIFSSPITNSLTTPSSMPSSNSKADNTLNIPSKFSSHDYQDVLSRIKPEPPPPMLSPLKSSAELESMSKERHYSSTQSTIKNNVNQNYNSRPTLNSKMSKTPPKKRDPISTKNAIGLPVQSIQSPKEKDSIDISSNVKIESLTNQTNELQNNIINHNNSSHANDSSHNSELLGSGPLVPIKQDNSKDKSFIGADVPSVSSHGRPQIINSCELDVKPTLEVSSDVKQVVSSPHQKLNVSNTNPSEQNCVKSMTVHNKEEKSKDKDKEKEKEKSGHDDKHHDKHHKHSHHSHKSSKHKDKHKHKHKEKDREKHKRDKKDKDKERDRDRDRDRHGDSKNEQSFKVSWSPNKEKTDMTNHANVGPIKLKISKKKLSVDEPDKDNDVPQNPLKLRIQLKDQKLTANASDLEPTDSSSGRKRKSSPKSSKKEKIAKFETDSNNSHKLKDDKSSSKSSSKSKKSSNDSSVSKKNNTFDDVRHSQAFNPFGHQTTNLLTGGQSIGPPQGAVPQRSSKTHK